MNHSSNTNKQVQNRGRSLPPMIRTNFRLSEQGTDFPTYAKAEGDVTYPHYQLSEATNWTLKDGSCLGAPNW